MIRKSGLFLVMLGGLSLSFAGQVDAVEPLLGHELAIVFAATNDVAALLALNEVLNPGADRHVRSWAWVALFLGGGTALVLNTWHAIKAAVLPGPAAILVGAEPVVLAWVLSHVVALVLSRHRREADTTAADTASETSPEMPAERPESADVPEASLGVAEAPEAAPIAASDAAQRELPTAAPDAGIEGSAGEPEALPEAAEDASEALPEDLIARAEKAERKALQQSGGKRGLPYREAPRKLGVRYDTARAALDAARARMATETSVPAQTAA